MHSGKLFIVKVFWKRFWSQRNSRMGYWQCNTCKRTN